MGNGSWCSDGKRFFSKQEEGFACGPGGYFVVCPLSQLVLGVDSVSSPLYLTSFPSSVSYFSPFSPLLPSLTFVCFGGIFSFPDVSSSTQRKRNKTPSSHPSLSHDKGRNKMNPSLPPFLHPFSSSTSCPVLQVSGPLQCERRRCSPLPDSAFPSHILPARCALSTRHWLGQQPPWLFLAQRTPASPLHHLSVPLHLALREQGLSTANWRGQ